MMGLGGLETRLKLDVCGGEKVISKAPPHIGFAVHDNRSKVFVRVEDNIIRMIAKGGQKILLNPGEIRMSLVTPEEKVEMFAKSLSANNDFAVASNRRF